VEVATSNPAHLIGLANFCRAVSFLRSLFAFARAGLSAMAKYHTRPGQHRAGALVAAPAYQGQRITERPETR
jgi:hypothetical protein